MSNWYITQNDNDLMHHGIKGQKWGVRRYQNPDGSYTSEGLKRYGLSDKKRAHQINRINLMYDRANKWTSRKIRKLDEKGKTAKANVMREMYNDNERARKNKIANVRKMLIRQDLRKSKGQDLRDALFGGQTWKANNAANMTTFLSRLGEYQMQRSMRWASNFTLNSTLASQTAKEGYDYLKRKAAALSAYLSGHSSGYSSGYSSGFASGFASGH